jgi:carnitine O-acetyltransferase
MNMYHPISKNLLNLSEIYNCLNNIVKTYSNEPYGVGIGALTCLNRDDWSLKRKYLIELDEENEVKLNKIEKSILILSLDDTEAMNNDEVCLLSLI